MLLPETLALHDKSKFEFHYIYFLPWKNQMVESIEVNGGKVTCLKATNNLKILTKKGEVAQYIKSHEIDLVHCHLPWAGFLGRLVFRSTRLPTLYTEHNKQERYHKVTKWLNKYTFNWQTEAIAVSNDVGESIRSNINPTIEVKTLLNGVNTEKFKKGELPSSIRKDLGIPDNGIVVGVVAVFRFQKRLKEWLQVLREVIDQNPDFYGMVIGDGPLKQEILGVYKELQLADRVFFVGLQEEVRPYYEAMDIFMMTSEFEGLPIALLEAMSMECAIFTTNAGGIKEVMTQEMGVCVDVDDWHSLSQHLLANARKTDLNNYSKHARRRAKDGFSLQMMVKELEREYLRFSKHL